MAKKMIKFLASLKLAVFVIAALAVLSSVGTFVEARYDLAAARKLVYMTPWMFAVLGLLAINLTAVMVDRWPWKRRHVSFILAHIGILILLLGSVFTMKWGVDGTMRIGIGESSKYVTLAETEFVVWSSFDGDRFTKIAEQPVDFFVDPPQQQVFSISVPEGEMKVVEYIPYALSSKQVLGTDSERAGAALRFNLSNPNVNLTEWLVQGKPQSLVSQNLGPARVHLGPIPSSSDQNEIYFEPQADGRLKFAVFYADSGKNPKRGVVSQGDSVQTGWMGLELKILRFLPRAQESWEFKKHHRPTPLTNGAIKILFQGKEHWVQLNDVVKFFTETGVYFVSYASKRIDLGFELSLKKFEVGRYPGTQRAASYSSWVTTPEGQDVLISMNEPLKYKGLTFYQASFTEGPGGPDASVLSVNYDPGRFLKYLGSLILSLGVVWMFWDKRRASRAQAPQSGKELI